MATSTEILSKADAEALATVVNKKDGKDLPLNLVEAFQELMNTFNENELPYMPFTVIELLGAELTT